MDKYLVQFGVEFPARDRMCNQSSLIFKLMKAVANFLLSWYWRKTHRAKSISTTQGKLKVDVSRKHVVLFTGLFTARIANNPPGRFLCRLFECLPVFCSFGTFFFFSPFAKRYGLIGVIYYDTEMRGFILVEWCNALSNM